MHTSTQDPIHFQELEQAFLIRPIVPNIGPETYAEPPHRHNFQELIWIRKGRGQHQIDSQTLDIIPRTFYLIVQGQLHHFFEGADLDGTVIRFTDDFLLTDALDESWNYRSTLFSHFVLHDGLTIPEDEEQAFQAVIDALMREFSGRRFGRMAALRFHLSILLLQLERVRRASQSTYQATSTNAQLYQEFVDLLEQKYRMWHRVDQYAQELYVTTRQLSNTVRGFTGKTAKQLIQDRLMLDAKRYLQYSNLSVKEIAFTLGYNDASYFSRIFKDQVGVVPNHFKSK